MTQTFSQDVQYFYDSLRRQEEAAIDFQKCISRFFITFTCFLNDQYLPTVDDRYSSDSECLWEFY